MRNTRSLERFFEMHGFVVSYKDPVIGELVFVRRRTEEAFDRVSIKLSQGELFSTAGVEVSIVPGRTALKSLCIYRTLAEASDDGKSGSSSIKGVREFPAFLGRVSQYAIEKVDQLAHDDLAGLLSRTMVARKASQSYLKLIDSLGEGTIADRVPNDLREEIDRILQENIVCIPNGQQFYALALQAIAVGCGEIEGDNRWLVGRNADTADDRSLMVRLQIMASRLAKETGWDLPLPS